jgi:hypothetical protein
MHESVRISCLYTIEKCQKAITKLREENDGSTDVYEDSQVQIEYVE